MSKMIREGSSPDDYSIPLKRSKSGRPKKVTPFSSYKCYEERDIEFFIHQISDNELIWNRRNSLNYDGNLIHATFDKIEICCQFLSRKNGENAARLWTELASDYKREKMRIEQLPSGIYSNDFEIRFPFMQQMWFLEISGENSEISKEIETTNSLVEVIASLTKKKPNVEAPPPAVSSAPTLPSSLSIPLENLTSSINKLITIIDRSAANGKASLIQGKNSNSDLIDHLNLFFEKIPKERHLEFKCKIFNFLDSLKSNE